jgi:uncharacterized protein YkwD
MTSFAPSFTSYLVLRATLVATLLTITASAQDLSRIPPAEQAEATRQFAIYRQSTDQPAREKAVEALLKMSPPVMIALAPILERDWTTSLAVYRATLVRYSAQIAQKKKNDPATVKEVKALREKLAKMRATKPTKEQLAGEGEQALTRLRALHAIALPDLHALDPKLAPLGESVRALTRMRAVLMTKYARLQNMTAFSEEDVAKDEAATLSSASLNNPAAAKTLSANDVMLAKKLVPPEEAECVRLLNEYRMLVGLSPCLIDPKLHIAGRDHSKDMATMNFFAHESPVKGKASPSDRAKLAGTTANAENIAMGMEAPSEANHGWFLSPGHHVNMFLDHRRVGIGKHERHWTELFGG